MTFKLFGVLIAILAMVMFILSVQDPYFLSFKAPVANIENIQINTVTAYELTSKQVKSKYSANTWLRYDDKDILTNFRAQNQKESVSAKRAIKKNKQIKLEGDVLYKDNKGLKVLSQGMIYDLASKVLSIDSKFSALQGENIVHGTKLSYDTQAKQLRIKGLKAWFYE